MEKKNLRAVLRRPTPPLVSSHPPPSSSLFFLERTLSNTSPSLVLSLFETDGRIPKVQAKVRLSRIYSSVASAKHNTDKLRDQNNSHKS